jgi:hypothetical protein
MTIDRDDPLLVGAIVYRLMGCRRTVNINFVRLCEALEPYGIEQEEAYHISCDIENYYERQDLR